MKSYYDFMFFSTVCSSKIGYLWVCMVVHGCKISFSKPTGHYLHKNITYVLFLIIIIHKAIRFGSGNDWSLASSIHSKCIPWSWDTIYSGSQFDHPVSLGL